MVNRRTENIILWSSALVFAFGFTTIFGEKILNGHDPANYELAIKYGINISLERPHAPGSPLLVCLWKIFRSITGSSELQAIVYCNSIFFALSIVYGYKLFESIGSKQIAIAATLFFATSPSILYYGAIAEVYSYDAFISVCCIYFFFKCKNSTLPLCALMYGVSGGFRLSSLILLAPVVAGILWYRRKIIPNHILIIMSLAFTLGLMAWVYPFYLRVGGIDTFVTAVIQAGTLEGTIAQNIATILPFFLWGVNILLLTLFLKNRSKDKNKLPFYIQALLSLWIVPALVFFVVIFYAKGYILLVLPGIIFLLITTLRNRTTDSAFKIVISTVVVFNLVLFFLSPFHSPSIESLLPKQQRGISERITTTFYRWISFFAPTYAHIVEADRAIDTAANQIAAFTSEGATIFVDRSASQWAYPRSLQMLFPHRMFITASAFSDTLVSIFQGDSINRKADMRNLTSTDTLFFLIDTRLPSLQNGFPPTAVLLSTSQRTTLYYFLTKNKLMLLNYLEQRNSTEQK